MMRKPCSRRIGTSSAVAPVAQGTPAFLQASSILSRLAWTSGWVESPRWPMATDMSPGPAQIAPMPFSCFSMSGRLLTPSGSSTMPINSMLPSGSKGHRSAAS